jgi:hypothetical protein
MLSKMAFYLICLEAPVKAGASSLCRGTQFGTKEHGAVQLDTVDGNVQHGKVELYSTTRGRTRHNKIREAFCFAQHGYVQLNKIHSQSCET